MRYWLSFLILFLSVFATILSFEHQLPTENGPILQHYAASNDHPHQSAVVTKKTDKEQHGGEHNGKKELHHTGGHTKNGDASKHDETSAKTGKSIHEQKVSEHQEKSGKKHSHHDGHKHSNHHHNGHHNQHGTKYAKGHKAKKNNVLKGYRQQYHKHEHKNHDSFYNNEEKKGGYHKFGSGHSKKQSELKKKTSKHSNGEKGESNEYGTKKTYKIEKPHSAVKHLHQQQMDTVKPADNTQHYQQALQTVQPNAKQAGSEIQPVNTKFVQDPQSEIFLDISKLQETV